MIKREQVIPMILEACPSFRQVFCQSDDKDLPYVVMGHLAQHLLDMHRAGQTREFGALCELIERLHTDGDLYVKELATIGLLEGIQNVWANNGEDPEHFCRFLLPESRKWWKDLKDFWQGKIKHVGNGVHNQQIDSIAGKPGSG